jgi:hypothetical protein
LQVVRFDDVVGCAVWRLYLAAGFDKHGSRIIGSDFATHTYSAMRSPRWGWQALHFRDRRRQQGTNIRRSAHADHVRSTGVDPIVSCFVCPASCTYGRGADLRTQGRPTRKRAGNGQPVHLAAQFPYV